MSKKSVKKSAAATPVIAVCQNVGINFHAHQFPHGSNSFSEEAAFWLLEHLGVVPEHIFKTLIIELSDRHTGLATAVIPATGILDLKTAAAVVEASEAMMADPHDASLTIDYVPGGISPLDGRRKLPTVIDETTALTDTVFVSGGRRRRDIELSPADLVPLCDATVANIAR